jgi:hypothetical protein
MSISAQKSREFRKRFQRLSEDSGYNLAYDTMALIQEFIPCGKINLFITSPKSQNVNDVQLNTTPLFVGSTFDLEAVEYFFFMYERIACAASFASYILKQAIENKPIQAYSFSDDPQHNKGLIHYFYQKREISDVLVIASLIARNQFVYSPYTDSYYFLVCNLVHNEGKKFSEADKVLLGLCFDIFIDDFNSKIRPPEDCLFLPQVTGEVICKKTKMDALFSTGKKFTPRELATIRACFDLKQQKRKFSAPEIARYLHLKDQETDPATLKKLGDNVKTDIKKIKQQLLRAFTPDTPEYVYYQDAFNIQHIPDVFKPYAYFGIYPDSMNRYTSYLEHRLGKYNA